MADESRDREDDAELVRAVAAGSEDALAALYDRHAPGVHATATRLTDDRQIAEEVVQETFLALWNRAELFNSASGSLAAWLHTIARNRTIDRLRASGRRPRLAVLGSREEAGSDVEALERAAAAGRVIGGADLGPDPEAALERVEVHAVIRRAVTAMPEQERVVILLAYRDGLSQSEIADRLGWPIGTVKTRTRRALARLRGELGPELGPDSPGGRPALHGETT